MEPGLRAGDRLLVERITYTRRPPRPGELALAPDPRFPSRELVKRVASVSDGTVVLQGDNRAATTDSAVFGAVPLDAVHWRVVGRYWPLVRCP